MAIAFDATAAGSALPSNSLTYSHTCSGSDRILFVGVTANGVASDLVTGVTYNGVSMTRAVSRLEGNVYVYGYVLTNPATGANNIAISASSSIFLRSISASYTGAAQSSQPDGTAANGVNGTSLTTNITTTTPDSWIVGYVSNDGALAMTAGAGIGSTRNTIGNFTSLADSNAGVSAGANSFTWTSGSQVMNSVLVSIAPPAVVPTRGFMSTNTKFW